MASPKGALAYDMGAIDESSNVTTSQASSDASIFLSSSLFKECPYLNPENCPIKL